MDPIDRSEFYRRVRTWPFRGKLGKIQVEGCETILDHWQSGHAAQDDRWLAYILGTAFHETAGTMAAIHEYGGDAYFERRYGARTAVGRTLGNRLPGDGARYHGRGFVQLTGRANYADWSDRLGRDLLTDPDKALRPDVAARILVDGAILGTFTGRRLADYFNDTRNDWIGARRIINRLDRAARIAVVAKQFWGAMTHGDTGRASQVLWRKTLRQGCAGEDVRFLQSLLDLEQDARFGRKTNDAVQSFQSDAELFIDGVVGQQTWRALLIE